MDDKDEIEEVRKMITSSGKEQNETGSTNRLDKDDEDHVLYGMKSDDELVSRKRKLVKLGNDNVDSKKEEEEAVMEVTKSSDDPLKKENEEEDMRNFKLVVKKSKALKEREEFPLPCESEIVIGRQTNACDVVISDLMISKRHCKIVAHRRLGPCVYDLGSKGDKGEGDAVKRFPIPIPQEGLMLKLHDELTIGSGTVIVLELDDPPTEMRIQNNPS